MTKFAKAAIVSAVLIAAIGVYVIWKSGNRIFLIDSSDRIIDSESDSMALNVEIGGGKAASFPSDTFSLEGKQVVFFSVSQFEYDRLSQDGDLGLDESLSDFQLYSGSVVDSIVKRGYTTAQTSSRYIKIILNDSIGNIYDRRSDTTIVSGYILSDGFSKFEIHPGVETDVEILQSISRFGGSSSSMNSQRSSPE